MTIILPGVNGREITKDYNQIHLHEGTAERRAKLEMFIAKRVGEDLVNHYPRRQWGVDVDIDNGVIVILCPSVSLTKGYVLHLGNYTMKQLQERARKAAGEILERHNVTRSRKCDPDAIESLPRTVRGDVVAPDAAPEPLQKRVV